MDIRWLQDFITLADLGNFTRAAETRNSSQAAFSRRIQSLEQWIGATLVDRAAYPTRLTSEGQQFLSYAINILGQIADARGELSGTPSRDHIRLALPYAVATTSFPKWWTHWTEDRSLSCSLVSGNIHDMITALVSGSVDILICFSTPQQPIVLEPTQYFQKEMRRELLRPYANKAALETKSISIPGTAAHPLPLLMYSPGVYFSRLVELIIEAAPQLLTTRKVIESDMADVLRDMAVAGHGIAWLPECVAAQAVGHSLLPIDDGSLSLELTTTAFMQKDNLRPAVVRLWSRL